MAPPVPILVCVSAVSGSSATFASNSEVSTSQCPSHAKAPPWLERFPLNVEFSMVPIELNLTKTAPPRPMFGNGLPLVLSSWRLFSNMLPSRKRPSCALIAPPLLELWTELEKKREFITVTKPSPYTAPPPSQQPAELLMNVLSVMNTAPALTAPPPPTKRWMLLEKRLPLTLRPSLE